MRRQLWLGAMALGLLVAMACPAAGAPAERAPGAAGATAAAAGVGLAAERPAHGAAIVVASRDATAVAKLLARRAYQEPGLRPDLDEATVSALVGADSACESPPCDERLGEIRELVTAVGAACTPGCNGSPVARRLLASLGRDLGVAWIVLVQPPGGGPDGPRPPSVQLLRVAVGRFEPMVLSAKPAAEPAEGMWDEVVPILRSVAASTARADATAAPAASTRVAKPGGPEAPATKPGGTPSDPTTAGDAEEEDEVRVLSSPWFWGGLGVLVAAGITVFALSQSSLGEPDTVRLEGRVAP